MLVHSAFILYYFFLSYLFNRMLNIFWGFKEYPQRCPLICLLIFFFGTLCMFMTKCFKNLANTSEVRDELKGAVQVPHVLSVDLICTSARRTVRDIYGGVLLQLEEQLSVIICQHTSVLRLPYLKTQKAKFSSIALFHLHEYTKRRKMNCQIFILALFFCFVSFCSFGFLFVCLIDFVFD